MLNKENKENGRVNLSDLRKNKGLTQQGLAEAIGISKSSVGMYETGQRNPTLKTAIIIAKYFGTEVEKIRFND